MQNDAADVPFCLFTEPRHLAIRLAPPIPKRFDMADSIRNGGMQSVAAATWFGSFILLMKNVSAIL